MVEIPTKNAPRLFLIDGYALIYRAYFAFINRPLTNAQGENTSAPWGFANFLIQIREEFAPDYLAVVFDAGTSQRVERYPEYKATREKMPEDLAESLPRIREIVEGFGDTVVEVDGYEADDVIGTLATQALEAGLEPVIVSGDKDFYQLLEPGVHLLNPGRGGASGVEPEWVEPERASERLGVPPQQVCDYLALLGDASDNVPGAPGIGPKTALKLLEAYGSVEELIAQAHELSGKRAREAFTEHAEQIRLSKELVTIQRDVPVELDLEALRVGEPKPERLRDVFSALEFRSLIETYVPATHGDEGQDGEPAVDYRAVTDPGEIPALAEAIRKAGAVSIDAETTSLRPMEAELVGLSLAVRPGEAFYLPFGHRDPDAVETTVELDLEGGGEDEGAGKGDEDPRNLPAPGSPELRPLAEVLADPAVEKVGQNLKYDLLVLERADLPMEGVRFDTMVASYVLDPGRRQHSLDALSTDILRHTPVSYSDVAGKGAKQVSFARVPLEDAARYACEDADLPLRLKEHFERELRSHDLEPLFHRLEMPLVPVLAEMERAGVRIDRDVFSEMSRKLEADLEDVERRIHLEAGEECNINSHPQLRKILFDKLGLPVVKRKKTGPSTDASVLEELAGMGHTLPQLILEYRQLEKLRSTYVDALPKLVNPATGRIHASFNQTVAATGRLSSSEPNLQNIPIRTELGRGIRRGFVAEDGWTFLAADYSQIELRILAHFSGDDAFVQAFQGAIDVHRQTASVIFDVDIENVTAEMRDRAKTINFATLYGQGAFSLGRQLGIPRKEAEAFIEEYFRQFSGVRAFLDQQIELARERGWVETYLGRRRFVPELKSDNWNVRQFGERVAQNTPIQGTAADLIKQAMVRIYRRLHEGGWLRSGATFPLAREGHEAEVGGPVDARGGTSHGAGHDGESARLLVQVHDELIFEVREDRVAALQDLVVEEMEAAVELAVPLKVEVGVGRSWYEAKG